VRRRSAAISMWISKKSSTRSF